MRSHRLTCLLAALSATVMLSASAARAGDLYTQNPINSFGGLSSQDARNPGGLGWFSEVADNFPGQAGWSIGGVGFWGGYAAPDSGRGNTEGFTIRFYDDAAGSPGSLLFLQDVFTFSEVLYHTTPTGLAGYEYSVDLDPPFAVPASGEYWVSVVAILARGGGATEPQWGWIDANTVNPPFAHQWFFSPGNFTAQNEDVALVLRSGSSACTADITGDGVVNVFDLLEVLAAWGPCPGCPADITGDGVVNVFDLLEVLAAWGPC